MANNAHSVKQDEEMRVKNTPIDGITPYKQNPRKNDVAVARVASSIKEYGFQQPIVVDKDNVIVVGHTRWKAAKQLGYETVPVIVADKLNEEQCQAYRLADNRTNEKSEWDNDLLLVELLALQDTGLETGFDQSDIDALLAELDPSRGSGKVSLTERFIVPPFSVLNARAGYWMDRKREWKALGIRSEEGRDEGLAYGTVAVVLAHDNNISDTSIFDPVLCEIGYKWFSKRGDKVLDPFAGGSVRGVIAAALDREYTGIDLSERQIEANKENWDEIKENDIEGVQLANKIMPNWITHDSNKMNEVLDDKVYDLVLSCPPYADLEVYSKDPADISNMDYDEFIKVYNSIIQQTVDRLADDRFIFWVVGEVRGAKGIYKNFVGDTINAFIKAGAAYYNEAIILTPMATVSLRAARPFSATRKLCKAHQNVLVFVKGDSKEASDRCEYSLTTMKYTEQELAATHQNVLVFIKGDASTATDRLGAVEIGIEAEWETE